MAEGRIARRTWLKLATAGGMLAIFGGLAWQFRPLRLSLYPIMDHERAMLRRIVDLFVPRDETPGALDLDVHLRVLSELNGDRKRAKTYAEALFDLDRKARAQHGAEFLALEQAPQEDLLLALAAAPPYTSGGRFVRLLRYDTMRFYYARSEAWRSLGFDGPPQPHGFPDYTEPPHPHA